MKLSLTQIGKRPRLVDFFGYLRVGLQYRQTIRKHSTILLCYGPGIAYHRVGRLCRDTTYMQYMLILLYFFIPNELTV